MNQYSYINGEERPVEVLVFRMDPAVVDEFIRLDHEVWTLGEAHMEGPHRYPIPFKGSLARQQQAWRSHHRVCVGHARRMGLCGQHRISEETPSRV